MKKQNDSGESEFGIYEVYYDDSGQVKSWTQNSLTSVCSSLEDLIHELETMKEAFKKETLEL